VTRVTSDEADATGSIVITVEGVDLIDEALRRVKTVI
jgi:uncharacterized protein